MNTSALLSERLSDEFTGDSRTSGTFRLGEGGAVMLEEHRSVRRLAAMLEHACLAPAWSVDRVLTLLGELAALAEEHFAHEESGGYMSETLESCPWQAPTVARLLREHAFMREELGALLADPRAVGRARVLALLELLGAHERTENELVQEQWLRDVGGS